MIMFTLDDIKRHIADCGVCAFLRDAPVFTPELMETSIRNAHAERRITG
jgi:hypothetical protein